MSILKDSLKTIILSALVLLLAGIAYAWTEPSQSPPLGNLSAPITISSDGQTKSGNLVVNSLATVNGLIVQNGNVGIGTTAPAWKLDVVGGSMRADGYTGGGQLCIGSDCRASWPSGGITSETDPTVPASVKDGTQCRICYEVWPGSEGQCQGTLSGCSDWSGGWTPTYTDDTDGRPGGCNMHWRIECQ